MMVVDTLEQQHRQIRVEAGQKLTYIVPVLSTVIAKRSREILLAGEGAEADVFGIFLGQNDDVLNLQLDTTHAAPNTRGRTEFRAVLGGQSVLEFYGMIKILKDAQGSNDFLQQDSLLLSSDAKANAVPGLEIEANEVKASHGSTAKPVDPEQKFYLMSRGLSAEQAEAMVVSGFLVPILRKMANPDLEQKILNALGNKFNLAHVLAE